MSKEVISKGVVWHLQNYKSNWIVTAAMIEQQSWLHSHYHSQFNPTLLLLCLEEQYLLHRFCPPKILAKFCETQNFVHTLVWFTLKTYLEDYKQKMLVICMPAPLPSAGPQLLTFLVGACPVFTQVFDLRHNDSVHLHIPTAVIPNNLFLKNPVSGRIFQLEGEEWESNFRVMDGSSIATGR